MGRVGSSSGPAPLDAGGFVANATAGDWFYPGVAAIGSGIRYISGIPGQDFATHALTCTLGTVYGSRIYVPPGEVINNLVYALQTEAEDTPVTAQNWVGIYSAAGNLLWTSPDQTANFGATVATGVGMYFLTPSAIVVPVGSPWVDVAFLSNADTTGIIPWVHLYTTLTPYVQGTTNGADPGTLGWTGRTSATTLAATAGPKTAILSNIFCGIG